MTNDRRSQVDLLLTKIDQLLNWGSSQEWTGTDFERLSDLIFEKSQQRLSVTTLKRVWGRTSQAVKPSNTTLDILSQFLGHENWRTFQSSHDKGPKTNSRKPASTRSSKRDLYFATSALGLIVIILIMAFNWVSLENKEVLVKKSDEVKLNIHKVTSGIPNTVIFRYDLGSISADSFELQQSWDKSKRILLDPKDSLLTTTYYTPGYFSAKLVADGQVIESQDLYIPSQGMELMVFLEDENTPRQLSKDHWSINSSGIQLNSSYEDSFEGNKKETILLVNLLEEPEILADSFECTVSFRLSPDDEGDPCHPVSIIVTGSQDVYMFEVGNTGCAGEFTTFLGGNFQNGKNNDFSALGFVEDEWVDFMVSKNGKKVTIKNNEQRILLSDSALSIGKIGGIRIYSSQKIKLRTLEMKDKHRRIDLLK